MTNATPSPPVDYVCARCGEGSVTRDAWAEWDVAHQCWRLSDIFDFAFCHRCHRETRLLAMPAPGPQPN